MSPIILLQEPVPPQRPAPSLRAFLELAFRPLYLVATVWASIAVAVWVAARTAKAKKS